MLVYFNGRFMPKDEVRISPDDRGILFADGIYEVIRSYNGRLFQMQPHLERLDRSLRELRIPAPGEDFTGISKKLLRDNGLSACDATVYIQITRGAVSPAPFPRDWVLSSESTLTVTPAMFTPIYSSTRISWTR